MNAETADSDASAFRRTLAQTLEVWVEPEIRRRQEAGRLPSDFVLRAAQVVMHVDGPTTVRLNDEIRVVVQIPAPSTAHAVGDNIRINWDDVTDIALGSDDPNAGHITIIRDARRWILRADFRYNAERANDFLQASIEFLNLAKHALSEGYLRGFAENLFAMVELAAKATLLVHPDKDVLRSKKHGYVGRRFNRWAKLGNTDRRNAELLNRLTRLRDSSRYLGGPFQVTEEESSQMLIQAERLLEEARARVPPRRSEFCNGAGR